MRLASEMLPSPEVPASDEHQQTCHHVAIPDTTVSEQGPENLTENPQVTLPAVAKGVDALRTATDAKVKSNANSQNFTMTKVIHQETALPDLMVRNCCCCCCCCCCCFCKSGHISIVQHHASTHVSMQKLPCFEHLLLSTFN